MNILSSLPEAVNITGEIESREVFINGEYLSPVYSQGVCNHSPDGFNWGYSGSGPAQLALAILMKYLPVDYALRYYQEFKFNIIAGIPQTNFDITINLREQVRKIIELKILQ
jgi:hypothetical protein